MMQVSRYASIMVHSLIKFMYYHSLSEKLFLDRKSRALRYSEMLETNQSLPTRGMAPLQARSNASGH